MHSTSIIISTLSYLSYPFYPIRLKIRNDIFKKRVLQNLFKPPYKDFFKRIIYFSFVFKQLLKKFQLICVWLHVRRGCKVFLFILTKKIFKNGEVISITFEDNNAKMFKPSLKSMMLYMM